MARYIATVEFQDGEYWISFPGIQKAGSYAKRPEDIVPHARKFLDDEMHAHARARALFGDDRAGDATPPISLDDAISEPIAPFEGVRLVIFEWDPP